MSKSFKDLVDRAQSGLPDSDWTDEFSPSSRTAYLPRIQTWMLQVLTGEGGMPHINRSSTSDIGIFAKALDMPILQNSDASDKQVMLALQEKLAGLRQSREVGDCPLKRNLQWLCDQTGLTTTEAAVVEFVACQRAFLQLRRATRLWDDMGLVTGPQVLAILLQRPIAEINAAIGRGSRLLRSGLVHVDLDEKVGLDRALQMPRSLAQRLALHEGDPQELFHHILRPLRTNPDWLQDPHFDHLRSETTLARAWLGAALGGQPRGGHMLIAGAAGLGKTVWVRHWIRQWMHRHNSSLAAFEIEPLQEGGEHLGGQERLDHLRMAIALMGGQQVAAEDSPVSGAVIVFDEADDIFESERSSGYSDGVRMRTSRALLNELLENSAVPVVWIMNHHQVLDPAVVRRFDVVLHFPPAPQSVRKSLLHNRLGDVLTEQECDRWSQMESLTPAVIDRVTDLHRRSQAANAHWSFDPLQGSERTTMLRHRLSGTDVRWLLPALQEQWKWELRWLNPDQSMAEIVRGLQRRQQGTVLIYGPPGTGKSSFAQELAKALDRPLRTVLASDVLRPYVGETEMALSGLFAQAQVQAEVLFIDEADSLLFGRDSAHRSWEVSLVNELLAQISNYRGVMVLATNRKDALDSALWRRMDIKVELRPMHPQQVWDALQGLSQASEPDLFNDAPDTHLLKSPTATAADDDDDDDLYLRVLRLRDICPGDIANVLRKWELLKQGDTDRPLLALLVQWLQEECAHKAQPTIGFTPGARP